MMTTAKTFNIQERHDAFLGVQKETNDPVARTVETVINPSLPSQHEVLYTALHNAVGQFLEGKITKAELKSLYKVLV